MPRRRKMSRKSSKRSFRRGAVRVHRKNTRSRPMRGGIRL
jgi:hypothetical protein